MSVKQFLTVSNLQWFQPFLIKRLYLLVSKLVAIYFVTSSPSGIILVFLKRVKKIWIKLFWTIYWELLYWRKFCQNGSIGFSSPKSAYIFLLFENLDYFGSYWFGKKNYIRQVENGDQVKQFFNTPDHKLLWEILWPNSMMTSIEWISRSIDSTRIKKTYNFSGTVHHFSINNVY